jgi:hypothetical protein
MAATPQIRLSAETGLYETHKAEWLKSHRDQFVVVKGTEVLGFFTNFHEAYYTGVENYGINTDFLVKRIVPQEPVFVVF